MVQLITEGISITVETFYNHEQSNPVLTEFNFNYRVSIDNFASFPIKLISRYWKIYDSNGSVREVHGEGVVGQQPILEPGESFQYISGASIRSEVGKMKGSYTMENLSAKKLVEVEIPEFDLIAPFKLN